MAFAKDLTGSVVDDYASDWAPALIEAFLGEKHCYAHKIRVRQFSEEFEGSTSLGKLASECERSRSILRPSRVYC